MTRNRCSQAIQRFIFSLVTTIVFSAGLLPVAAQGEEGPLAPVHPLVLSAVARSSEPVSFLVILNEQPEPDAFLAERNLIAAAREKRGEALYSYLTNFASTSQAPLWSWLDEQGVVYRPFYIINAVEVYGDAALIGALRQRPEVARLAANPQVHVPEPEELPVDESPRPDLRFSVSVTTTYGVSFTKAPEVWAMGYTGLGVVVASQDTGVQWDHDTLKTKYRGWHPESATVSHKYNWFDAWGSAGRRNCDLDPQIPCDDNGHGTHTVGTILGSEETRSNLIVGMAPDAQWIGCRNMQRGTGTPASYTACFEFFLAPYPQSGDPFVDGKTEMAPDLINNSWYCPPSEGCDYESLQQVISTVRAAGQLVVVSAGNNGPSCETIRYPISAYADVFSVGAHDSAGTIAGFSSRGPVTVDGTGRLKPEIAAPGVSVRSARLGGGYSNLSGTSMAAPHVAGAVALLWSAAPALRGQLQETEQILIKSATPVPASQCMPEGSPSVPNPTYGYGHLNIKQAVDMALNPARVSGVLTDTTNTQALTAQVTITDTLTGAVYNLDPTNGLPLRLYPGDYELSVLWQNQVNTQTITLEAGNAIGRSFTLTPDVTLSIDVTWFGDLEPFERSLYLPMLMATP